ncbi:glycosyltransferase, HpnB family [Syntrophotalea carbinolica DSM 2380]|uniref:Glycosyltransferase, HpnB family n=1 Tax=Syntrophotalea carbinolica (strain DSM 2380 / NBRC 103641 / GraBd1) TaxID=338963 RepID=Q3A4J9_SYNC1|nr:glycosyltransferase [Syntrophotalea carbinolica]ABA88708.1 glycosyltransferase, HpnB family [Syntrophotalea carbinolica DSM 2380]
MLILAVAGVLSLLIWIVLWFWHGGFWRVAPLLPQAGSFASWPAVDVVIPARNEADILPSALPTILNQDYPGEVRVFLVDDHSCDDTSLVASRLAAESPCGDRLILAEAATRPEGWTGKLWALQQGLCASEKDCAPLVLFTDADIAHEKDSLSRLVTQLRQGDYDLVSLMAKLQASGFWSRLLIPAFVYFFAMLYPFRRVADKRSRYAGAAGGCVLLQRRSLQHAGGLQAISGALIDDCSLGRLIKRHGRPDGGNIWLGFTREVVSVRPCRDLATVWRMVVRTAFVQLHHSWLLLLATVFGMMLVFLTAPVCLIAGCWALLLPSGAKLGLGLVTLGVATWFVMVRTFYPMVQWYDQRKTLALLLPLAASLYTLMTVDSAVRFLRGAGGAWKGRTYGEGVSPE